MQACVAQRMASRFPYWTSTDDQGRTTIETTAACFQRCSVSLDSVYRDSLGEACRWQRRGRGAIGTLPEKLSAMLN